MISPRTWRNFPSHRTRRGLATKELTQQNKVAKVSKEQDVKYKEQESSGLKEAASELTSDKDSASAELSAVVQCRQVD